MTPTGTRAGYSLTLAGFGLLLSLVVTALLWTTGDSWPPAFALLYGPRWSTLALLLFSLPLIQQHPRRGLGFFLLTLLIILVGLMGLRIGPARLLPRGATALRVLTYNLHSSSKVRDAMLSQLERLQVDVALAVECSGASLRLPEGWEARTQGEMCIFSRYPITEWTPYPQSRSLARGSIMLNGRPVDVGVVHLTSPRAALTSYLSKDLRGELKGNLARNAAERHWKAYRASGFLTSNGRPLIVGGDFNLPPESRLYRQAFAGYQDAFESAGWGFGFTWRSSWHGLRIDHLLLAGGAKAVRTWLGPDLGSDHLPVIADIRLPQPD